MIEPTADMRNAYIVGCEYHGYGLGQAWMAEIYGAHRVDSNNGVHAAFFEAGVAGHCMPRWVQGWRFGSIPAVGHSFNHRDGRAERGVSLMALDGAAVSAETIVGLPYCNRPRVRVAGWLIGYPGADGEPLIVGAVGKYEPRRPVTLDDLYV